MLDIQRCIVTFLEQQHELSLPGIGLIRYTYQPAEVLRYTRRILPPRYKIEFFPDVDKSADDFVQFLSKTFQIAQSEAQESFANFLSKCKEELAAHQSFYLSQLGTFRYVDNKIVFEEDKESRLLSYNLGNKDVQLPPPPTQFISEESKKPVSSVTVGSQPKVKRQLAIPLFVKIGLSLAGVILIVFFLLAQTNLSENIDWAKIRGTVEGWISALPWTSRTNPSIEELRRENREALAIPAKSADTVVSVPTDTTSKVPSRQLVYYIIAGSYKNRANAEHGLASLRQLGFNPKVLNFNDTLFRVSLASFVDRQKAVSEYIQITQQHPELKIWFYSRYE